MEGTPRYLDYSAILETFLQIDGVVRVHNLRIWALSVNKIALAAHLAVGKCFSAFFALLLFNLSNCTSQNISNLFISLSSDNVYCLY